MINRFNEIHLELTSICNLSCDLCFSKNTNKFSINYEHLKKFLKLKDIKLITICGAYGEPTLHPHFKDIVLHILSFSNIRLSIYTNGSTHNSNWWYHLGELLSSYNSKVNFALDGLEDTHYLYRKSSYNKVYNHMKSFIKGGGKASWQMILFKHNQHQIDEIQKETKYLGVELDIKESHSYKYPFEKPTIAINKKIRSWNEKESFSKTPCSRILFISALGEIEACPLLRSNRIRKKGEGYLKTDSKYLMERFKYKLNIKDNKLEEIAFSPFFKWLNNNKNNIVTCKKACSSFFK